MHRNLKIDTEKVRQRLDNVHHETWIVFHLQPAESKLQKMVRRLEPGYAIWVLFAVVSYISHLNYDNYSLKDWM